MTRKAVGVAIAAMLILVVVNDAAGSGSAASTCGGLQTQLSGSAPGATITVSSTVVNCSLVLPGHAVTLQGDGGGDDGFDGNDAQAGTPILSGTDVGTTAIRGLFFKNATVSGNGAAIVIVGNSSPTIDQCVFTGNSAGGSGGAVDVSQASSAPNSPVTVTNSTFGSVSPNRAGQNGGGLQVDLQTSLTLSGNTFSGNIASSSTSPAFGGGVDVSVAAPRLISQSSNVFLGNRASASGFPNAGGGEAVIGFASFNLTSRNDRFTGNSTGAAGEGGGLFLDGQNALFHGENLVAATNDTGNFGAGSGIYAEGVTVNLDDATVTANSAGGGSAIAAGTAASGSLTLTNSIVFGNTPSSVNDVSFATFSSTNVSYSDVCIPDEAGNPVPYPGSGDICTNPLLVNPTAADVHQTATSPTLERGSNALVPPTLTKDFEGDARILDGNNDGNFVVDMGADERQASPTSVTVTSFAAHRVATTVRVTWHSAGTADLLGFNLYRQEPGTLMKLNRTLIPSLTPRSHTYAWHDRTAPEGTRTYRLQAVDLSGKRSWVGQTSS